MMKFGEINRKKDAHKSKFQFTRCLLSQYIIKTKIVLSGKYWHRILIKPIEKPIEPVEPVAKPELPTFARL